MGDSSKITTDIAVDDAIQLDANYRLDRHDRRYMDNQILGCEEHLVDSLLSGYTATWGVLDGNSTSVNIGDVLCAKHTGVTKATTADLANAGSACGVVVIPASPGTKVRFAIGGVLPAKYSGLGTGAAQPVRVNTTTGTLERVPSYSSSDYPIGIADVDGNVTLDIGAIPASVSGGSMFVPTGTGFVHITSGTEDVAARAVNLNSGDVTNVLNVTNGGTGLSSMGTSLQVLRTNSGATALEWATLAIPSFPLSVANGGTGLTALGSALQYLRTNAAATAMEWATLPSGAAVSGSGLWHSSSGALDAAASIGTANQVMVTNSGATDTVWALLVNANVSGSAAIDGTKISPNFGSQLVQTTGNVRATALELTSGGPTITEGTGVPATAPPNGSVFLRTDGTSSTTAYVRASGAWTALGPGGSTAPGGSNTWMQYNNAGSFGGTAEFTYSSSKINVSSTGAFTFGSTPSTTSYLRFTNASQIMSVWGGAANIVLLDSDASNNFYIGGTSAAASEVSNLYAQANSTVNIKIASSTILSVGAAATSFTGTSFSFGPAVIAQGSNSAFTGDFRAKNNWQLNFRNNINSVDYTGIHLDSSNILAIGGTTSNGNQVPNLLLEATTEMDLFIGSTAIFTVISGLASVRSGQNLSIGDFAASMSSATNSIYIKDGTQPTGAPSTGVYVSSDSGSLHFRSSFSSAGVPVNIKFVEVSGGMSGSLDPDHAIKIIIDKPGSAAQTRYLRTYI